MCGVSSSKSWLYAAEIKDKEEEGEEGLEERV